MKKLLSPLGHKATINTSEKTRKKQHEQQQQ